ncbi:MAG: pyrroline-5-carboxylate reductase, partial [Desulfobacca sp.]|uniref:pyrroline-5-carboxylate reductase n=1 Tax=Desulfobacca sp. TaxID=2067990 RepID=UPI00404AEF2D
GWPVDTHRGVARRAGILLRAVKPHILPAVLADIKPESDATKLVISIAAGVPLQFLAEQLPDARLIRVMPNTPTLVRAGMAALAAGPNCRPADLTLAQELFAAVGQAVTVPEHLLNAVTGLSGSGPAYVFLMLEALADGGVKMGLPRATALLLAAQTILGAAKLFLETRDHPGVLKDMVTSPAGTTITGLHVLEQGGFRGLLMAAVEAAAKRSAALAPPPPASS